MIRAIQGSFKKYVFYKPAYTLIPKMTVKERELIKKKITRITITIAIASEFFSYNYFHP